MNQPTTIYYFATCLIDLLYPKAGLAGMQLLRRAGVEVIFPPDQSCCGQPAFNSGYRKEALAVARAQLHCFSRDIPIVIPSASCAGMVKHHWPELFAGQADESQALAVAQRTYELSEFLTDVLSIQLHDLGEPINIAVHHSCTAQREMQVADHSQQLLAQLQNVRIQEHERPRECCGFGGTFCVKYPEISTHMVSDKVSNIEKSGADTLLGGDLGCLLNMSGRLKRLGKPVQVYHTAEVLAGMANIPGIGDGSTSDESEQS